MRKLLLPIAAGLTAMALALPADAVSPSAAAATGKFTLGGTAAKAKDPTNVKPTNHVISIDTTDVDGSGLAPTFEFGFTSRILGVSVPSLDDHLALDYYLVGRTCAGGAPRYQLAIDTDGDGASNGNAFGYLGDQAFGGGCASDVWVHEDMTNAAPKWDISQFGGPMATDWDGVEAFFAAGATVLRGSLVDDASWCYPPTCAVDAEGLAYFDNVEMGTLTLSGPADTIGT